LGATRSWASSGRTLQWRNSPSIVNRALPPWKALTFASQIHLGSDDKPTGVPVVYDLSTVTAGPMGLLEIQAHFPPTGRDNMLGLPTATNTYNQAGSPLQIKSFNFKDPQYATPVDFVKDVWSKITLKILQYPGYQQMFADAYPGVDPSTYTFLNIGRAIAAFESAYFVFDSSPWDRYVRGDVTAMTDDQKAGAELFYTRGCSNCHAGSLFTDQLHHNIGVPAFGPGPQPVQLVTKNADLNTIAANIGFPIVGAQPGDPHIDFGVAEQLSGADVARNAFAVRTIPLHNVELTGPYMHNGTYNDLTSVIKHHLDASGALDRFDSSYLQTWLDTVNGSSTDHLELRSTKSPAVIAQIKASIDPRVEAGAMQLSDPEIAQVVEFLKALTDPALKNLPSTLADTTTPSGLPIDL
jgi:cytochrome c peroxidase